MDHADLVAEINLVEKMTPAERLKHAKKRRAYQLKQYNHYEKKIDKESSKKRKNTHLNNMKRPSKRHKKGSVDFVDNIKILEAAARNDVEEVRLMVSHNVDPNLTNEDGLTALHQCCIDESQEMLSLLLEYGADVNARDSELWTPLHAAATCGHIQLCEILVLHNADLLAVNADGNMPYDICEDEATLDFVENEMAKRGITQEQIDETRLVTERHMLEDLKNYLAEGKSLEDVRDENGVSPLHIAAANGYLEVGKFLLDHKVPVNIRDDDSWEPIHAAACWQQSLMLDLLVQHGADIDSKTKMHDTPFDICEDPDIKQKILDMKDELENKKKKSSGSVRKNNRPNNRSLSNSPMSYLFNSNSSISDKTPFSASMRRSSMRGEKSQLFMKEVKEEAAHFGLRAGDSNEDIPDEDDEDEDEEEKVPGIANVNDVELIFDDMNGNELPAIQSHSDLPHPHMNGNHQPEPGKRVIPPLRELGEGVRPRTNLSAHLKQPTTVISSLLIPTPPSSSWAGSSGVPSQKSPVDARHGSTTNTKTTIGGETKSSVSFGEKTKSPATTTVTATGKLVTPKTSPLDSVSGHSKGTSTVPKSTSSTKPITSKSSTKATPTTTTTSSFSAISSISAPKGSTGTTPKASAPTGPKEKSKENADPSLQKQAISGKPPGSAVTQPSGTSVQPQLNIPSVLNEVPGANNSANETPKLKPRSESRYPTGGSLTGTTLIDLKRQRIEKYNRSGASNCNGGTNNNSLGASAAGSSGGSTAKTSSLDSEIQNMFLANVLADRSPIHSPSLGKNGHNSGLPPSGTDSNRNSNSSLNTVGTQSGNNNNNMTTGPRTTSMINGNQQSMRKFSASSSVQVIGGDDDEKRNCCIII